jgi:hypothetical protein
MPRIQITRLRAAAATALLSLAAPAFASHDDWDDDDYGRGRGYPVYSHDQRCGHHGYDRDYGRGGYYGNRSGLNWPDPRSHREYSCRPCRRRYGDERSFYHHLRHQHGVPPWTFAR